MKSHKDSFWITINELESSQLVLVSKFPTSIGHHLVILMPTLCQVHPLVFVTICYLFVCNFFAQFSKEFFELVSSSPLCCHGPGTHCTRYELVQFTWSSANIFKLHVTFHSQCFPLKFYARANSLVTCRDILSRVFFESPILFLALGYSICRTLFFRTFLGLAPLIKHNIPFSHIIVSHQPDTRIMTKTITLGNNLHVPYYLPSFYPNVARVGTAAVVHRVGGAIWFAKNLQCFISLFSRMLSFKCVPSDFCKNKHQ